MASRLQQFWDNILANLASSAIIVLLGAAGSVMLALFVAFSHGLARWEQAGIVSLFSIVLIGLVVSVYLNVNRGGSKRASKLALALISEECEYLLRSYRRLSATDPANTNLPLHPASWPVFNPAATWTHTQVSLCCLSARFGSFVAVAGRAFGEMGFDEYVEVFQMPPQTLMVDLLAALQDFRNFLQAKIASLEGRK